MGDEDHGIAGGIGGEDYGIAGGSAAGGSQGANAGVEADFVSKPVAGDGRTVFRRAG